MMMSEILRAGKARIEQLGWCQGDEKAIFSGNKHGCCTGTALQPAGDAALDAIKFLAKANGIDMRGGIGIWNDAPERTVDDVLAAYDNAIAAAELQEAS
jgi:hypothetical protein